jgi:hypothetical protein
MAIHGYDITRTKAPAFAVRLAMHRYVSDCVTA